MGCSADTVVTRAYRFWCTPGPAPQSVGAFRSGYAALFGAFPTGDGVSIRERRPGGVRTLVARPDDTPVDATVIYCHGGGFVCGNPEAVRHVGARFACAIPAEVLLPDYRLAPEHPHPAAVNDVLAVYRATLEAGRAPAAIAVAGESAGAGLALAALVAARRAALPLPGAAVCFSPWVDLTLEAPSIERNAAADTVVDRGILARFAAAYLAGADPRTPTASPLYADMSGFPPLFVQAGSQERLFDDARALALRAQAAGVPLEFESLRAPHAVQLFVPDVPEAAAAVDRAARFLSARLSEKGAT